MPFKAIYKKFIESDKAPLEVNISHASRTNIKNLYNEIEHKENDIINENKFWDVWIGLHGVGLGCIENLLPSMTRWQASYRVLQTP